MVSKEQRQRDILNILKELDISPTMFKNATDKYKAIATYLQNHDVECDIYPQGSFALGTVVKPLKLKQTNCSYDLDCICQVNQNKENLSPKELKLLIGNILKESNYNIEAEYSTCWTIIYADINEIGFSIDIVPSVDEDIFTKNELIQKNYNKPYTDKAIAITKKYTDTSYRWATNNPKGYKLWFDEINKPFLEYDRLNKRSRIFMENRGVFNCIEEIPAEIERSSLQIAIQLLKRHRDVYYSKKNNGDDIKPISAIITTICTLISKMVVDKTLNPFELLSIILKKIHEYSELQIISNKDFYAKYQFNNIISRNDGKWILQNPVNPDDNLLDTWNSNPDIPKNFFKWIEAVYHDFCETMYKGNDNEFFVMLQNSVGLKAINKDIEKRYSTMPSPTVVKSAKPWKDVQYE